MEQEKRNLLARLQMMPENHLTKEVIMPLLVNLGYEKVEFFGGPSEYGKDIVCWELDKMEEIKLTVVQVKHFKLSNKAAESKSLQTVVNQLTACFKKTLPYVDKTIHFPREVCLISTHEIDTKSLETRFGHFPDLADQKIKLIDGIKLASLLFKHNPILATKLLGINYEASKYLQDTLTNEALLKALGYQQKKEVKTIFTNIDFSLGKLTTQLFFNGVLNPKRKKLSLGNNDWKDFKSICLRINKVFGITFLKQSFEQIEKGYNLAREKQMTKLQRLLDSIEEEFEVILRERINDENKIILSRTVDGKLPDNSKRIYEEVRQECEISKKNKLASLELALGVTYQTTLDGNSLAKSLMSKRVWIEERVRDYNTKKLSLENLKDFIEQCKEIIDTASLIFSNPNFFSCIGHEKEIIIRNNFESTRFELPIQSIFETGLNITVLGEAGAGKTTSLQVYALNEQRNNTRLVLFISLTNLVQQVHKQHPELFELVKFSELDGLISRYLVLRGLSVSTESFRMELSSKKTLLLFDGIDEVIKLTPWIPEAIAHLVQKYAKTVQVIVSSRMSGTFLNRIPFFAVTILPFTNEQRNSFVEKWFNNENKEIVNRINRHLEKNKPISEIIRTPLLTTTLCVLANNEIPLPNTEIKLYNERMRLLTGYYDLARNIKSRIESTPQLLEFLAQKLAFYLHSGGQKEANKEELEKHVLRSFSKIHSSKQIEIAFEELIDPCNILLPMTDDGKYGFGHLRYQEFLVAREISTNRAIEIYDLLNNVWWHDSLLLFGQMNSNLYWLIDNIGKSGRIYEGSSMLREMIYARPKYDHKAHYDRLNAYLGVYRVRDERFDAMDTSDLE
jgi:hypothetical protein